MKNCSKCQKDKEDSEFYTRIRKSGLKLQSWCKVCVRTGKIEWRAANPERHKASERAGYLKRTYSLTLGKYNKILLSQDSKCPGCGKLPEKFDIDRDHITNKVRGLLCHCCNVTLGYAYDNPEILRNLAKYLESTK